MEVIIESQEGLEDLLEFSQTKCFLSVITDSDRYHDTLTDLVAFYLRPHNHTQGYIIPVNHPEGENLGIERVREVLKEFVYLYSFNRKKVLYHFSRQDITDVSLLAMLTDSRKLEINTPIPILDLFYRYNKDYKGVNQLIPLVKLYEQQDHLYNSIKQYLDREIPDYFQFYNDTMTKVFYLIEQEGIGVEKEIVELYQQETPQYNISKGRIYTNFNLYNHTTRPSNSFNGINFAAIPKEESYRKVFKPKNDYFVQFDFDSYHLRLLSNEIGYPLTEESAHIQLARLYFNTSNIDENSYKTAKQLNFEAMYGKIPKEYEHLEFFQSLRKFINDLWKLYQTQGYVLDPISKRPIGVKMTDLHATKLLNYYIQSLETSRNVVILRELLRLLSKTRTKVVHYIYDAIIIDYCKEDGKDLLTSIEEVLSQKNKYPVKFSYSKDLCL